MCEYNTEANCIGDCFSFQQEDAAHLSFSDRTFTVAVNNFIFHEVHSKPDKHDLIIEALRVIKQNGFFVFEDVLFEKRM